ncbi:bifunctional phosphopantothenoylcysteine decarboxylase/phosphopantothenate--cysteine ligase CoaBC [Staphylococcus lugdunensis]|jgi:phosphopantothenoylcysteine decarboxylase/phosphopantothenate--cysteine ligase|uniref:bifunctional phosphopantothenoylcysteine decarboxylase/phosphopantothenate--cysteine ligase CoaBC n=1 Tax=Staphylococcus lugdunensis TaxID=28035 RepID=UPI00045A27E8|nr:bifunctional phosphopantothenoylcysteine decarboxylase/phosphopantothenate--cysteine ligase CoaBC [Staphylococcus lugdunensis]KAK55251.1 phosphopantothenoylcysteine decarboxylase/phosphopantothenate--cysteine ligase [Staphylococcus lugdunensis VCU150]MCI2845410.1 bifunctional phosphopantothenoylcysteine decarboxylase/phosphopantothenate--cysteine ligase CoaBC [Staphylococcus lugdunensis]MDU4768734.1 bifunctional phosphopantothenoylcysteine decarboxylase/phosphopantothenate--cysteine ligase Co
MKHILLAVTGGIAAYKAIDLTSKLTQAGYEVKVMLTEHAQQFVTPLAFQAISRHHVYTNTFIEAHPEEIQHVALGDWADVIVVAPATANTIAKLSAGIADDMVTSTLLATKTPKFIAPAMNVHMYENPRTLHNISILEDDGYHFIQPGDGFLACGYVAKGRMEEPLEILNVINRYFDQQEHLQQSTFKGKHALVTAGPTVEVIDPVRFVSNRSSGKMGYALAQALKQRGAIVTLVTGPTQLDDPQGIEVVHVQSAEEMFEEVTARYQTQDIVFKAAAVSDYTPKEVQPHKVKKQDGELSVVFKRTPDILKYLGEHKAHQYLVGFAAETQDIERYAQEKLTRKNADVIISNNVGDTSIGFSSDDNELTMHFKNHLQIDISKGKKIDVAQRILDELETRWH